MFLILTLYNNFFPLMSILNYLINSLFKFYSLFRFCMTSSNYGAFLLIAVFIEMLYIIHLNMSTTNNIVNLMFIYENRNKPVHRTGRGLVY